ncbi:hypothetical protein EV715DRAFT_191089 [Schizophyllum commune]
MNTSKHARASSSPASRAAPPLLLSSTSPAAPVATDTPPHTPSQSPWRYVQFDQTPSTSSSPPRPLVLGSSQSAYPSTSSSPSSSRTAHAHSGSRGLSSNAAAGRALSPSDVAHGKAPSRHSSASSPARSGSAVHKPTLIVTDTDADWNEKSMPLDDFSPSCSPTSPTRRSLSKSRRSISKTRTQSYSPLSTKEASELAPSIPRASQSGRQQTRRAMGAEFNAHGSPTCYPPPSNQQQYSPLFTRLRPWLPLILYLATTLAFICAIAFWKDEVFARLDDLAHYLQEEGDYGKVVMFSLIFLTTIPPIPLYSTLTVLSGYTFGPTPGFVIAYAAALSGAMTVFGASRYLLCLQRPIVLWLGSSGTIRRVVRAIEKRPRLLFLIRLAPYPYNVMNCLLAASKVTLPVYFWATAISLFKIALYTWVGGRIHSFSHHATNVVDGTLPPDEAEADHVARLWTFGGIALCLGIFVYLSIVARRAVDEELDGEEEEGVCRNRWRSRRQRGPARDAEERVGFLDDTDEDDVDVGVAPGAEREMSEVRSGTLV